jgi:2-C-methyl-D-erythritol 4-phosphate cytidylyltransferase
MTRASVYIECLDEDKVQDNEEQNYEFQISKWERENKWTISTPNTFDIKSLRRIKEFEILLIRLYQNNTEIIVDTFDNAIEKYFEYEP